MAKIKLNDRIGTKYKNFTIISIIQNEDGKPIFNCKCVCTKEFSIGPKELFIKHKEKISCGCIINKVKTNKNEIWLIQYNIWINATFKKNSKLDHHLSYDEWKNICTQNCNYCGIIPNKPLKNNKKLFYHGIDRVNSNIGYIYSNCVSCCTICNFAKNDLTVDDFLSWVNRIGTYQFN